MARNNANPKISVVIPTLGRDTLIATVESVLATSPGDDIGVLVVGKLGSGSVASKLSELTAAHSNIRQLPVSFESGDSSQKKNEGWRESRSEIVAFLDDDVLVSGEWPDKVLAAFDDPGVGMVSGPSLVPDDLPLMARLAGCTLASKAAGYVADRYLCSGEVRNIKWSGIIGCNMAFRKGLLERLEGFDPRFWPGEEMVASFKVSQMGYSIVFQPEAFIHHYPRASFPGFIRQIHGYGATRIRLIREGLDVELSTLLPAAWVLSLLILGIGAVFAPWAKLLLLLNLGLYAAMALLATILKVAETRRPADALILFLIPIMHLSYGVAEWVEVFCPDKDLSVRPGV